VASGGGLRNLEGCGNSRSLAELSVESGKPAEYN